MTTAPSRSCIKASSVRNPWVSEEICESSNSSSIHSRCHSQNSHELKSRSSHGVLAAQYATPYQNSHHHSSTHSQSTSGHSGHSMPTESETHPMVSPSSGGQSSHTPGVMGAPPVLLQQTMNGTQSVYSMSGPTMQAPHPGMQDHKVLWAAPQASEAGHAVPGGHGVFTVAGDPRNVPLYPHTQMHHGATGTLPIGDLHQPTGWCGTAIVDSGRCYQCNVFCFRCAQVVFVLGIIAGFSLLVAGGVYQKHQFPHLQVLVYIGAMIALVSVVLLVIFCAVNRRPTYTKRAAPPRTSTSHHSCMDPESVPLRAVSDSSVPIDSSMCPGVVANQPNVINGREFMQCIVRPTNHSACSLSTNPSACSTGSKSVQFNLGQLEGDPGRKGNDCVMGHPMMVSGTGYSMQPSGEMFLMNPGGHNMGAPNIMGGTTSHQGCLVPASHSHGHLMPINTSGSVSSHIAQSHHKNSRCDSEIYDPGPHHQYQSYYMIWKDNSNANTQQVNDQSSKL